MNGSQASNTQTTTPPPPPPVGNVAPNQLPITVSAGPGSNVEMNRPFASVTICGGTTTCQTINNVLVDTGSSGLRLFSSLITIPLATQPTLNGMVYECIPFENTYAWGPVVNADVHLSGEVASNASIQLIGDTTLAAPAACANGLSPMSTPQQSGVNGILGILGLTDCGSTCTTGAYNQYWACADSACQALQAPPQPVGNPVSLFPTDNNGIVFDMPGISSAGAVNVQGSIYFGIGTQSNNQLGSAVQYQQPFLTQINGNSYFVGIDSGTPWLGVLNDGVFGLPLCGSVYCPPSPVNFTYEIVGTNGATFNANLTAADPTAAQQAGMTADQTIMGAGPGGNTIMLGFPFFYNMKLFFSWANPATGSTNYVAF